ncbi:hypothetical protein FOA52_002240 [Chlamydomonas sp. UWO 241]|nr:hypothetical protein FOA52_002240 [Chlamydomonas sp. UWO 241]
MYDPTSMTCLPDITACAPGTTLMNGTCFPDITACAPGTTFTSGICVPDITACSAGTIFDLTSATCIVTCCAGSAYDSTVGACVPADQVAVPALPYTIDTTLELADVWTNWSPDVWSEPAGLGCILSDTAVDQPADVYYLPPGCTDRVISVSTCSGAFDGGLDTAIAVYTGDTSPGTNPQFVACNDFGDTPPPGDCTPPSLPDSALTFTAVANVAYSIVVRSYFNTKSPDFVAGPYTVTIAEEMVVV